MNLLFFQPTVFGAILKNDLKYIAVQKTVSCMLAHSEPVAGVDFDMHYFPTLKREMLAASSCHRRTLGTA